MIKVVKIGGNVIDNPAALAQFLDDFAALQGPKILVHGGGKEATRLSGAMGIETTMINGRRVTDGATLEVVTMVYAGLINKRIVSGLQARGVNALGLTGADGRAIVSHRRPAAPVDYGFVGDIDSVNRELIESLLGRQIVPVFCAITCDAAGQLLNSNADSVAGAVALCAASIGETELHFCFDKQGVLLDIDDPKSIVEEINESKFAELKSQGVVHSGMLPKIENALSVCRQGVNSVFIEAGVGDTYAPRTRVRL
ncbi:MAG: acetylglutamate kinase [Muribaculaceae bacterium]|nr:acetylglutamate kinase [Muribaculaceae bacterium]